MAEDEDQRPAFYGLADITLEGKPEAEPIVRGLERETQIGRDQFCGRAHSHHPAGLLELPVEHRAAPETGADAGVSEQILRLLRPAMLRNVLRRGHHRLALPGPARHPPHLLPPMFPI